MLDTLDILRALLPSFLCSMASTGPVACATHIFNNVKEMAASLLGMHDKGKVTEAHIERTAAHVGKIMHREADLVGAPPTHALWVHACAAALLVLRLAPHCVAGPRQGIFFAPPRRSRSRSPTRTHASPSSRWPCPR